MNQPSSFPGMGIEILFEAFLLVLLGGFISGTSPLAIQTAFAADAPAMNEMKKEMEPNAMGLSKEEIERLCSIKDPVNCVGIDVSKLPYPGCNSGQRCTTSTSGQICSMPGLPVRRCQTINLSGVCHCDCIQ